MSHAEEGLRPARNMLRQHPDHQRQVRLQAIVDSTKPFRSALLPVFASDHWTLLICHKESAGFTWRLYDSLSVPMQAQQEARILLGSLLDSEFVLPERANSAVQPQGSNLCLNYAEEGVRLLRKEPQRWLLLVKKGCSNSALTCRKGWASGRKS